MKGIIAGLATLGLLGCAHGNATPAPEAPAASTSKPEAAVIETAVAAAKTDLVSEAWVGFRDVRDGYLDKLGTALVACTQGKAADRSPECERRKETFELAFGLATLYRVTKDPKFKDAADAAVDQKALRKIDGADLYTSSWFLALAREREVAFDDTSLRSKANDVALRLEGELSGLSEYSFAQGAMFGNENNIAWALYNVWSWAEHAEDDLLQSRLGSLTKDRILGAEMDSWCPMPVDSEPENHEFLPPCLQRATTVLSVMPSQVSNPWLSKFLAAQTNLEPIRDARLSTHASLNFSRAWSLWAVYETTADGTYRDLYVAHVQAEMDHMARQEKKGEAFDPWQAIFGVYAVAQSYS